MSDSFREAADRRKQQQEAAWQAYLAADPICWRWTVPDDLDNWTYPQGDDIDHQLSERTLAVLMGNPESRAAAILGWWQDGRCAVCGRHDELVEDHDHATGLTRGYLCRGCNTQEGVYGGDDNLFGRYRRRHPTRILGLTIRYFDLIAGEYAQPLPPGERDPWRDNPTEGIGL